MTPAFYVYALCNATFWVLLKPIEYIAPFRMATVDDNPGDRGQTVKHWEELRRLARQYENDIDSKLLSLSKLMMARNPQKKLKSQRYGGSGDTDQSSEPLIGASATKDNFDHLTEDLDQLIRRLQDVNQEMNQCTNQLNHSTGNTGGGNAILYTVQRHQEILNDYRKEFLKLKSNIEQQLNRDMLFETTTSSENRDSYASSVLSRKSDHLLKENEHIRNSEIMIDDQIQIAIHTRERLRTQRSTMKAIRTELTTLANKFPMINQVMHRIGIKKRKDSIILATVIGICFFLLLLWIF